MTKTKPVRMSGELCRVLTDDGLELNGLYVGPGWNTEARSRKPEPAGSATRARSPAPGPFCVVHVHGWDGNFYENRFIDYAGRVCGQHGIGFLSGNNRGHDYIADILRVRRRQGSGSGREQAARFGYVQVGGMYEKLTDSVADIRAWIDFAARRGAKRIVLQGHSHGAIKVTSYLSVTGDPRVSGLVLLSPSDDMGMARRQLGERYNWVLARAREMVSKGSGRKLLSARDFSCPVSAATFFDCHNKSSITGIFNLSRTDRTEFPELAAVRVPVLMAVGTVEEAFVGSPQKYVADVEKCMVNCPSFTGAVIQGAPHNYLGHEPALAAELEGWLQDRLQTFNEPGTTATT